MIPETPVMRIGPCLYLFFVCLYVKFFRVLQGLLANVGPDPESSFCCAQV
jgi:hypothetical protein